MFTPIQIKAFSQSILLVLLALAAQAQSSVDLKRSIRKARPKYLSTSYVFGTNSLRDTGTSPRFFDGYSTGIELGYQEADSLKEFVFSMEGSIISLGDGGIPEQYFWNGPALNLSIAKLWKLKKFRDKKIKIGLGVSINALAFFRTNDEFFNAGFGLDNVNSLGAVAGLYFPFARKKPSQFKLWFINIKSNPRQYALGFRLHLPALTLSARPEYAYLTNVVDPETASLDTYTVQFGGYLVNTELYFNYYLHNGNGFQLNYRWTALETSDSFALNIARHRFTIGYLFRLNNLQADEKY